MKNKIIFALTASTLGPFPLFVELLFVCFFAPLSLLAEPTWPQKGHYNRYTIEREKQKIQQGLSEQEPWVGLVGDSGITGAASSYDVQPNFWSLSRLVAQFLLESRPTGQQADPRRIQKPELFGITNLKDPLEPLVRILFSKKELAEAKEKKQLTDLMLAGKGALRIDMPEYSFGYLLGRAAGIAPHRIVTVAQNGQRVTSISNQLERFLEVSSSLPSHILVSFTANDICGKELFLSPEEFRAQFRSQLIDQFQKIVRDFRPHPALGTRILVLAPLDVRQVLANETLLNQEIQFQGQNKSTCRNVRKNDFPSSKLTHSMVDMIRGMCRNILSISYDDQEALAHITLWQSIQMEVWREVLEEFQSPPLWTFEFLEKSRAPLFEPGDLAMDCFHPGPGAHSKIAESLLGDFLKHF